MTWLAGQSQALHACTGLAPALGQMSPKVWRLLWEGSLVLTRIQNLNDGRNRTVAQTRTRTNRLSIMAASIFGEYSLIVGQSIQSGELVQTAQVAAAVQSIGKEALWRSSQRQAN